MASRQDPGAGLLGCLWMLPCPPCPSGDRFRFCFSRTGGALRRSRSVSPSRPGRDPGVSLMLVRLSQSAKGESSGPSQTRPATARGAAAPTTRRLIGHVPARELGEARDAEVDVAVVLSGVDQALIDQSLTNRRIAVERCARLRATAPGAYSGSCDNRA